ncbi:MAG: nicotinate-nucleotide--dimethylbenzimidazole phosphoribosyltransferase, partial [Burkholderiales bacterium]|nr:nicotinate-nucleotide--dimethylbenzimidazole phosphoribosyltransferase [Burkholderiales bacterium]
MNWVEAPCKMADEAARSAALARQGRLTKPPGALGSLEEIAVQFAAWQGREKPEIGSAWISIFASDHGIAEEGVSLFPQAVTAEMVRNFARGGAAISVLSAKIGAHLEVINLGTVSEVETLEGVFDERIASGTANFSKQEAMSREALGAALESGRRAAFRAQGAALFIGGEMGIANTTSASAIACALLDASPHLLSGPGTGLDGRGVAHKAEVIGNALLFHRNSLENPM